MGHKYSVFHRMKLEVLNILKLVRLYWYFIVQRLKNAKWLVMVKLRKGFFFPLLLLFICPQYPLKWNIYSLTSHQTNHQCLMFKLEHEVSIYSLITSFSAKVHKIHHLQSRQNPRNLSFVTYTLQEFYLKYWETRKQNPKPPNKDTAVLFTYPLAFSKDADNKPNKNTHSLDINFNTLHANLSFQRTTPLPWPSFSFSPRFCLFVSFCHVAVSSLGVCSVSRMTFGTDGWLTVQPQTIAGREVESEWPECDWHASKMPVDTGTRGWDSCLSVFGDEEGQIARFVLMFKGRISWTATPRRV